MVAPWVASGKVCTVGVGHQRKPLIEMFDNSLEEKLASRVDERLARVVRIIVDQYDGDVKAFVESIRYRVEVDRKAEAASERRDEAVLQQV